MSSTVADKNSAVSIVWNRLAKLSAPIPLITPAGLAAFSVVAIFFLLINQFRGAYIWPIGLVAAIVAMVVVARQTKKLDRPGSRRERRICDVLIVVGVILWVLINGLFTSQHLYTNRDPATYAETASWLTTHTNLHIPQTNVFGDPTLIKSSSAGFGASVHNSHTLFAQGAHLMPALLGLVGKIVGVGPMLHLNVIFAGTALLALYAFGRMLVRPRWAVVAVAAMSLTLPLMYFSRDTYTEPLMATFTFGALALLWAAQATKKYSLWFLAGLAVGAGAMARIDSYIVLAAFAAFSVVYLILAQKTERGRAIIQNGLLIVGAFIGGLLGWLDVSTLSDGYYIAERHNIIKELYLILAILVLGALVIFVSWRTRLLGWLDKKTHKWRAPAAAIFIILGFLVLASRPLWFTSHSVHSVESNGMTISVSTRNYSEQTVNWIVWYLGPVLVIAGALGLAIAAYRLLKHRQLLLMASLFVVIGMSALYLPHPDIYPDQIWASRRMLPVIMPGFAVFGALALEWLYSQKLSRRFEMSGKTLATIMATLAVVGPLFVSYPFLTTRTYVPQLGQIEDTCHALPKNAAVLWVDMSAGEAVQPTRTFCNVPSEGTQQLSSNTIAEAAKSAEQKGYVPIVGVYGYQSWVIPKQYLSDMKQVSSIQYTQLEESDTHFPRINIYTNQSILLGKMNPNGSISSLAANQ